MSELGKNWSGGFNSLDKPPKVNYMSLIYDGERVEAVSEAARTDAKTASRTCRHRTERPGNAGAWGNRDPRTRGAFGSFDCGGGGC